MSKFAWVVVAALAAVVAVGCDREAKSTDTGKPTVAVVNFVTLQQTLGVAAKVQGYMQEANTDLNTKFNEAAKTKVDKLQDLQREVSALVKALPEAVRDNPKELERTDKKKFDEVQAAAKRVRDQEQELRNLQGQYQELLNKYKQKLEETWQASLEPAMADIAKQKGLKLILPKNVAGYVSGDSDVTSDLETYLKAKGVPPFAAPPKVWDLPTN
ncbi:MAG: OmpH family outer membrane protein [Phycisphaerae bacterium]|nr:OmpH family outer membrane protein [Phycisphaerae bacterium]